MPRRPLPPDPWLDMVEQVILDTTGMFAAVEERLIRQVALELRRIDIAENQPRLDSMRRLRRAGEAAAIEVRDNSSDLADMVISRAIYGGETFAEAWVRMALKELPYRGLTHGALATGLLAQDLSNRFDDVTRRILRWPTDTYRQVIAETAPGVLLGVDSTRSAQARAWQQLRRAGITGFVDKADRRWNLATYVEMATRTASRRAYMDANLATLGSYGINLVTAVGALGQCEACGRWVGQVMSQGGPTGTIQVPHATRDTLVTVRVKGTVDEAIADGFLHPNCRHTLVGYFPGMNQDTGPAWTQDAEDAQANLRALEVDVRRAKRDAAGALTTDEARAARAKVRDLQSRIRGHVKETGEPRRREREQLNYGHHPGAR